MMGSHGPLASLGTCVVTILTLLAAGNSAHLAASNSSNVPASTAVGKESDFPGYLDNILGYEKAPCEADVACSTDEWCSADHVCRPCEDIGEWCNNTELIHSRFPACLPYCYHTILQQAELCRGHNELHHNWLAEKEALQNSIVALGVVTGVSVLWALAASCLLWPLLLRPYSSAQGIWCQDSAPPHDKLLEEEDKCPIEDNISDSGVFYGEC